MGGSIKKLAVVVVAAVVAITLGGAPFLVSAIGATGATIVGALAGAAITAIASKALGIGKLKLGDAQPISSYATTSLRNNADNNLVRPIIYGTARAGGNRPWFDLETGSNLNLYSIIVIAQHELNAILEVLANNQLMTEGTGGDVGSWRFANDKILVKAYTKKPVGKIQAITSFTAPSTWVEDDLDGKTFQNTTWLDTHLPDGDAFLVIHNIFNATDNASLKDITTIVEGKLIRTITSATTISTAKTFSSNPAEIILDFITDSDTFNIPDAKIDIPTFFASKTLSALYAFDCNIGFASGTIISAALEEIKATARINIINSQGVWKIKQDEKDKVAVLDMNEADVLTGTMVVNQRRTKDIANRVIVTYIEPADQWQTKQEIKEDTGLQTFDGGLYIKELKLRGVTNSAQALLIAELTLNQLRYTHDVGEDRVDITPLDIKFETTIKNARLEVGDVQDFSHFLIKTNDGREKQFEIMSLETEQSGKLIVTAREYSLTHYQDTAGDDILPDLP